jgi:hypothetical protein
MNTHTHTHTHTHTQTHTHTHTRTHSLLPHRLTVCAVVFHFRASIAQSPIQAPPDAPGLHGIRGVDAIVNAMNKANSRKELRAPVAGLARREEIFAKVANVLPK